MLSYSYIAVNIIYTPQSNKALACEQTFGREGNTESLLPG